MTDHHFLKKRPKPLKVYPGSALQAILILSKFLIVVSATRAKAES